MMRRAPTLVRDAGCGEPSRSSASGSSRASTCRGVGTRMAVSMHVS